MTTWSVRAIGATTKATGGIEEPEVSEHTAAVIYSRNKTV